MKIYQFDEAGAFTGAEIEHDELKPIPKGWTHKEPVAGRYFGGSSWSMISAKQEPVPAKITVRQARQWMIQSGLFADVEAAIAAITDPTEQAVMRNYWEYSADFERGHPLLISLADALSMTSGQLDQAFREASKL